MERLKLWAITIGVVVFNILAAFMWIWMPILMWYAGVVGIPGAIVASIGILILHWILFRDLKGVYN